MRRLVTPWLLSVGILFATACGGERPPRRVEIQAPERVRGLVEEIVPAADYWFISHRNSHPLVLEDMSRGALLVCAESDQEVGIRLMMATFTELETPMFGELYTHFIDDTLAGRGPVPGIASSEKVSVEVPAGSPVEFLRNRTRYGIDTPPEIVTRECLKDLWTRVGRIVLLPRGISIGDTSDLVEIVLTP